MINMLCTPCSCVLVMCTLDQWRKSFREIVLGTNPASIKYRGGFVSILYRGGWWCVGVPIQGPTQRGQDTEVCGGGVPSQEPTQRGQDTEVCVWDGGGPQLGTNPASIRYRGVCVGVGGVPSQERVGAPSQEPTQRAQDTEVCVWGSPQEPTLLTCTVIKDL